MASTAISAQGSTLQVGNGSGSAKTITAVAVGSPTILTATAHGFANGDVVTFAGLAGTNAASLNGLSFVIRAKTTNTFAVDVDTTGLTITAGSGTATPVQWTAVGNFHTFSGFGSAPAKLEITNMASAATESKRGLPSFGAMNCEFDLDNADAGQALLLAANVGSLLKQFKLTLPNAATATFSAWVDKWEATGAVDGIAKRAGEFGITGAVTWA